MVAVTLTATSALRRPTAWARHSSGSTSARVELKAIDSRVPGADINRVIHTMPCTCPPALANIQGKAIKTTNPRRCTIEAMKVVRKSACRSNHCPAGRVSSKLTKAGPALSKPIWKPVASRRAAYTDRKESVLPATMPYQKTSA